MVSWWAAFITEKSERQAEPAQDLGKQWPHLDKTFGPAGGRIGNRVCDGKDTRRYFDEIMCHPDAIIEAQPIIFGTSAPLTAHGMVNVSPNSLRFTGRWNRIEDVADRFVC